MNEEMLLRIAVLGLRGKAKTWGTTLIKEKGSVLWDLFKHELVQRFTNQKESGEALKMFLTVTDVKLQEGLNELLKNARILRQTRGIDTMPLMRQVIARVPAGIKSLLLQAVQDGSSWDEFIRAAEESVWMVFPEKTILRISEEENDDINRIGSGKKWYCHLHGKRKILQ